MTISRAALTALSQNRGAGEGNLCGGVGGHEMRRANRREAEAQRAPGGGGALH